MPTGSRRSGFAAPPEFAVAGPVYAHSLRTFGAGLRDGNGFEQPGDTHFAFVIPERAFEDQVVLRAVIELGLVSKRLAACLLMTDFPNPLFSARRAALLEHVPAAATVTAGASTFSQDWADAILAAAGASAHGSPEREFAERWNAGEAFEAPFDGLLSAYYDAVGERLKTQAGFDGYCRLAESRRERVRAMPIFENQLLFATTNIPPAARAMRPDGSVT